MLRCTANKRDDWNEPFSFRKENKKENHVEELIFKPHCPAPFSYLFCCLNSQFLCFIIVCPGLTHFVQDGQRPQLNQLHHTAPQLSLALLLRQHTGRWEPPQRAPLVSAGLWGPQGEPGSSAKLTLNWVNLADVCIVFNSEIRTDIHKYTAWKMCGIRFYLNVDKMWVLKHYFIFSCFKIPKVQSGKLFFFASFTVGL